MSDASAISFAPTEAEVEVIACACHQANRAYCLALGDDSQPLWDAAPEEIKELARSGVRAALQDPNPANSHRRWMEFKLEHGWVYGSEKDMDAKTHPCLVPYEDLPEAQRLKDSIFISTAVQTAVSLYKGCNT